MSVSEEVTQTEVGVFVVVAIVATAVLWIASSYLEKSSEKLAKNYKLPPIIQGSIVVAVGSSFPELSSTVISTVFHGDFELGVSVIVGSAVFNILFIPAASTVMSKGTLGSNRDLVYKEAQFNFWQLSDVNTVVQRGGQ